MNVLKNKNEKKCWTNISAGLLASVFLAVTSCSSNEFDISQYPDGIYAEIVTSKGVIIVNLLYKDAPLTVLNFIGLAEGVLDAADGKPYYNGLTFHRVIQDFMIQGGDPQGNGSGGPGYQFLDEIVEGLVFDAPGMLAMANSGPDTNGSQFFITHVATEWLNGKHTIFGKVLHGQKVVDAIEQGDVIERIVISRKGTEAKSFVVNQDAFDTLLEQQKLKKQQQEKLRETESVERIKKLISNYQVTQSGIYYTIEKKGNGKKPLVGSKIAIHYELSLIDGGIIDSSYQRNQLFETILQKGRVIDGWYEMFLDMTEGEKRRFALPPHLAYGAQGTEQIPPNSYVLFTTTLEKIISIPNNAAVKRENEQALKNAIVTESGIAYSIVQKGQGEKAGMNSFVSFEYRGALSDGMIFGSSAEQEKPMSITLEDGVVIPGFLEMLVDMRKDEKRVFRIPSRLGYGSEVVGSIPADSDLIFTIDMKNIEFIQSRIDLIEKVRNGRKGADGIYFIIEKEGTGKNPQKTDTIEVHYQGLLPDGSIFDSSYQRGQAAVFQLNRLVPGFITMVSEMKVGEKRSFLLPAEQGYGKTGAGKIPPNSEILFTVELLSIK